MEFRGDNIAAVSVPLNINEAMLALVSKKAIENNEINWAMCEEPDNEKDSGWRLFYGNEDDEYNSDTSNIAIMTLGDVLSFEPRLESAFASEHTMFEWSQDDMRFIEVSE